MNPEDGLHSLFGFLGEDMDARVYEELDRPSPLSRKGVPLPSVDGWRAGMSIRQLEKAGEILALFGLDRIYGEEPMPDPSGAHALMEGT